MLLFVVNVLFHVLCMSVDCIVADDNPLLDFISIKNLNLNLLTDLPNSGSLIFICPSTPFPFALQNRYIIHSKSKWSMFHILPCYFFLFPTI